MNVELIWRVETNFLATQEFNLLCITVFPDHHPGHKPEYRRDGNRIDQTDIQQPVVDYRVRREVKTPARAWTVSDGNEEVRRFPPASIYFNSETRRRKFAERLENRRQIQRDTRQ